MTRRDGDGVAEAEARLREANAALSPEDRAFLREMNEQQAKLDKYPKVSPLQLQEAYEEHEARLAKNRPRTKRGLVGASARRPTAENIEKAVVEGMTELPAGNRTDRTNVGVRALAVGGGVADAESVVTGSPPDRTRVALAVGVAFLLVGLAAVLWLMLRREPAVTPGAAGTASQSVSAAATAGATAAQPTVSAQVEPGAPSAVPSASHTATTAPTPPGTTSPSSSSALTPQTPTPSVSAIPGATTTQPSAKPSSDRFFP